MYRCHHEGSERRVDELSAPTSHAEVSPQQRLRRRRTQAHQNLRLHHPKFSVKPGTASVDFGVSRLFVNASFSSLGSNPFEMFHDIGQIHLRSLESCFFQCFVEQLASGTNKRTTGTVLLIAGLFADKHDPGFCRAFSEDGLRRRLPQIARFAIAGGFTKTGNRVNGGGEPGTRYLACPFWRPLRAETSDSQDGLRCGSEVQGFVASNSVKPRRILVSTPGGELVKASPDTALALRIECLSMRCIPCSQVQHPLDLSPAGTVAMASGRSRSQPHWRLPCSREGVPSRTRRSQTHSTRARRPTATLSLAENMWSRGLLIAGSATRRATVAGIPKALDGSRARPCHGFRRNQSRCGQSRPPADRRYAIARQRRGHDQATDDRRLYNGQSSSPSDAAVSHEP